MGNNLSSTPTPEKLKDQIFSIVLYYTAPKANPNLKFALRDNCSNDNLPIPEQADYESLLDFYSTHDMQVYRYLKTHVLNNQENVTRFYQTLINQLAPPKAKKRMNEMIEAKISHMASLASEADVAAGSNVKRQTAGSGARKKAPARLTRSQLDKISDMPSSMDSEIPIPQSQERSRQPSSNRPPTERSSRAPTERSSRAPTERSSRAPTERSSRAPTERSSRAPTERSSRAPTERSSRAPTEDLKDEISSNFRGEESDDELKRNHSGGAYSEEEFTIPNEDELEKYLEEHGEALDYSGDAKYSEDREHSDARYSEDRDHSEDKDAKYTEDEEPRYSEKEEEPKYPEEEPHPEEDEPEPEPEPKPKAKSKAKPKGKAKAKVEESTLSVPSEYRSRNRFGKKCMIKDDE